MYNEENCRFLKTHEWAFVEGENAVVGACTLVNRDIPDGATAVGVPCRILPPKDDDSKNQ